MKSPEKKSYKTINPEELWNYNRDILHALKIYSLENLLCVDNTIELSEEWTRKLLSVDNQSDKKSLYFWVSTESKWWKTYFLWESWTTKNRTKQLSQNDSLHEQWWNIILWWSHYWNLIIRQLPKRQLQHWLNAISIWMPCERIAIDKKWDLWIYYDKRNNLYRIYTHIIPGVNCYTAIKKLSWTDYFNLGQLVDSIYKKWKERWIDWWWHWSSTTNFIIKHEHWRKFTVRMIDFDSKHYR